MTKKIIGIMGAMPEEIEGVILLLNDCKTLSMGNRTYFSGHINSIETVVVFSRWGKVAAATTVSTLIHYFNITELIFTGVAGAIHPELNIGDIVLAKRLIQHDMDARPLMNRYEIPLLSQTYLHPDSRLLKISEKAISYLLESKHLHEVISDEELNAFNVINPKLYIGDIASGDQFFSTNVQKNELSSSLPEVLCVEMEGAAVAQVCFEYNLPFTVIRTISDVADHSSHLDFPAFIKKIASTYSTEIIKNIYTIPK